MLRMVTALAKRMRSVTAAIAVNTTGVAETAMSSRWCSPTANTSRPDVSASFAAAGFPPDVVGRRPRYPPALPA